MYMIKLNKYKDGHEKQLCEGGGGGGAWGKNLESFPWYR